MNKNWFNVALFVVQAVQQVQRILHTDGETKKQKAIEISDVLMNTLNMTLDKEVLSNTTVQKTRGELIEAIVAFENAVAEAKFNLGK